MPVMRVEFDMKEWGGYANAFGGRVDQIPFALATAMNRSADVTRMYLIKNTWPQHVQQRNASFIAASLTTKEARASKQSLAVEIYDKLNRGNLQMQAKGGTRTPKGGSNLAIPVSTVKRTARGVPTRLRPRNLRNAVKIKGNLFTRDKKGRLKLAYALKRTTRIPPRVPFHQDFAASMSREMTRTIPLAMAKAMATARK